MVRKKKATKKKTATKKTGKKKAAKSKRKSKSRTAASADDETRGAGRPSKYDPAYCEQIVDYFSVEPYEEKERIIERKDGTTITETVRIPVELPTLAGFAIKIGVHRDTLHEWSGVHDEFSDAIKRAKEHQYRILVANGLTGLYHPSFAIFSAKNLIEWRDNLDLKHGGRVQVDPVSALLEAIDGRSAGLTVKP